MTPDLQSSIICDDVRQERNGKFILIGIYDVIGVPSYPAMFQRVCIVNRWCCGVGEFNQRTRIISPDGKAVTESGGPIRFTMPDDSATVTNIELFMNVKFEREGTYWIEVLVDDQMKLRYPLKAVRVSPPAHEREG